MQGLMQDWPLLCHRIIDHAAIQHGARPVVTRSVEGPIHTTNYAEIRRRALKVAQRLERDGIKLGDRVATMAWNTWRHLEAWYGILGIGAVYHTLNPRLFPDQIVLDRQPRRRPAHVRRPDVPAAAGEARDMGPIHRALRGADRRGAHAEHDAEERGRLRRMDRRGGRRFRVEELRREAPPAACATHQAPPAIPRACSTRTAPTCCTPSWQPCPTQSAAPRAT